MTDATTPEQPRTAAGRALLEWRSIPRIPIRYILAIEAEAQARPAVASEGLRAALGRLLTAIDMFAPEFAADVAVVAARAALASDAGSVGALETLLEAAEEWAAETLPDGYKQRPSERRLLEAMYAASRSAAAASDAGEPEIALATWMPPRPDFSKPPEPGNEAWRREDVQALASDAGSVGALDVERLRVIAGISENRVTVEQADALGWLDGWLDDAERQGEGA